MNILTVSIEMAAFHLILVTPQIVEDQDFMVTESGQSMWFRLVSC